MNLLLLSAQQLGGGEGAALLLVLIILAIWIGFAYWVYKKIGTTYSFVLTLLFSIAGACFSALLAIAENSREIKEQLEEKGRE